MLKVTRNLIKYTNITFNLFYSQSQRDIEQISSFITALKDVSDFDSNVFHLSLKDVSDFDSNALSVQIRLRSSLY